MKKFLFSLIVLSAFAFVACGDDVNVPEEPKASPTVALEPTDVVSPTEKPADTPAPTATPTPEALISPTEAPVYTQAPVPTEMPSLRPDVSERINEAAEFVGAVFEPSEDMAKLEKIIFEYMEGNLVKKGGPYVMPTCFGNGEYFAFYDINNDGRDELLIEYPDEPNAKNPRFSFFELFVPGDTFDESDLGGGICEVNPETGVVKLRSDGVEVEYLILEGKELKPYIKYTLDPETPMGPEGTYTKVMADGSSSKVSGEEALGLHEGFIRVENLDADWKYLSEDMFIIATRMRVIPSEALKDCETSELVFDENGTFCISAEPRITKYVYGNFEIMIHIVEDKSGFFPYYIYSRTPGDEFYRKVYSDTELEFENIVIKQIGKYLVFGNGFRTDINSTDYHFLDSTGKLYSTARFLPHGMRITDSSFEDDKIEFLAHRLSHGPSVVLPKGTWEAETDATGALPESDVLALNEITTDYPVEAWYTLAISSEGTFDFENITETEVSMTLGQFMEEIKNRGMFLIFYDE